MKQRKKKRLKMIADWVKEKLEDEGTGHDWSRYHKGAAA